jgi:hypothetical protein
MIGWKRTSDPVPTSGGTASTRGRGVMASWPVDLAGNLTASLAGYRAGPDNPAGLPLAPWPTRAKASHIEA